MYRYICIIHPLATFLEAEGAEAGDEDDVFSLPPTDITGKVSKRGLYSYWFVVSGLEGEEDSDLSAGF